MPSPFKIDLSRKVAKEVKSQIQQAVLEGRGSKAKAALRIILHRLRNDPFGFGEPTNFLKHLKLLVHVGVIAPWVVHFGIHEEKEIVYIQKVQLLSS